MGVGVGVGWGWGGGGGGGGGDEVVKGLEPRVPPMITEYRGWVRGLPHMMLHCAVE